MVKYTLTVGKVPLRKGKWLGVETDTGWRALAKFRSDEAADEFLDFIKRAAQAD